MPLLSTIYPNENWTYSLELGIDNLQEKTVLVMVGENAFKAKILDVNLYKGMSRISMVSNGMEQYIRNDHIWLPDHQ